MVLATMVVMTIITTIMELTIASQR
jgi:hypothetical protein